MMSTPSATASSIARARSAVLQLARIAPGSSQQALYTAIRARGAMPLIFATRTLESVALT